MKLSTFLCVSIFVAGCGPAGAGSSAVKPAGWLGIPSAVNQIIVFLHEGTGWMLNKSEVAIKKTSDVRVVESASNEWLADFKITVEFGNETFETTATDVPCDKDGIPTEAAVGRLRSSVEDIKTKMKQLQN